MWEKGSFSPFCSQFWSRLFIFSLNLRLTPTLNSSWRRRLLAPHTAACLPKHLLPVSCKSTHRHCCGWWSVLSPPLPHWSNWKGKVPPLWLHVQVALCVCQSTGCEQLINNYCFYVLPQGQGCNLQQEGGFKWVWSLNYCWNIVTAYRLNCLSVRSLFHLGGPQLLRLHCLLIQQCGQDCDVRFIEFPINGIIHTI